VSRRVLNRPFALSLSNGGGRTVAALACALAFPLAARAHEPGISHGAYALEGDRLEVMVRISAAELTAAFPALASPSELRRAAVPDALVRAVLDTVTASQGVVACARAAGGGRPESPDGARFSAVYRCPNGREPVRVRPGFVPRLPPGHVHLARAVAGGETRELVVDARGAGDGFAVEPAAAWWADAARFTRLGVEHIFTGWDHLAFLLALLLAGGTLRGAVRVVTGFTAGHALTLALATLGAVRPSPALVEPLIAASVVVAAAENLRDRRRGLDGGGRRWPMALAFGLAHGFGFAAALSGLGLPRAGLATALASFNLGIELGQAAIVALVFPLLALLRHFPRFIRTGLPSASAAVACAGLAWLLQRIPW
jgi:hydrogenase/urease accessory protein HupE